MTLAEIKALLKTENKSGIKEIIEFKKAQFKTVATAFDSVQQQEKTGANKELSTSTDGDTDTMIKRTIIGNTYNWMDSHKDVHLDGTFSQSIKQRENKIWHLHDHEYKLTAKVGKPTKVYEKAVLWSDLGVDKTGFTTSLMMDTDIMKSMNEPIFIEYKDNTINQHSVGMYYVKMDLAVNDKDEVEEFKVWNQHIDKLGNKDEAEKNGYFWAVKEAKLIEISAVLEGSNSLTPTVEAKDIEPFKDTQIEPLKDTQNQGGTKGSLYFY